MCFLNIFDFFTRVFLFCIASGAKLSFASVIIFRLFFTQNRVRQLIIGITREIFLKRALSVVILTKKKIKKVVPALRNTSLQFLSCNLNSSD